MITEKITTQNLSDSSKQIFKDNDFGKLLGQRKYDEVFSKIPAANMAELSLFIYFTLKEKNGIDLLKRITKIYPHMLSDNSILDENIVIPSTVEIIDSYAFSNCPSIKSVTFEGEDNGVREIMPYAFYNCNKLNNVYIPKSIDFIGCKAFNNCPVVSLHIPRKEFYAPTKEQDEVWASKDHIQLY